MADLRPIRSYPTVPLAAETRWKHRLHSATPEGLAHVANHLVGWRFLREAHLVVDYDRETLIDLETPDGLSQTLYIPWLCSERAQHVLVMISYQASPYSTGGVAEIQASLQTEAEVLVDQGVIWQADDETLEVEAEEIGSTIGGAVYRYPVLLATTGVEVDDNPVVFPSWPRPLNVGAHGGEWLEVVLQTTNVRILSASIREAFEEVQAQ